MLSYINVTGLFQDPLDLEDYTACDGTCFTADSPYPVSSNMASTITDIIIKTKMAVLLQSSLSNKPDSPELPDKIMNE